MAFHFASAGSAGFGAAAPSSNVQVQTGPDLEEIQTEALGFHAIAGESKIRLLPSAWPSDGLPPPTSSLLSIASRKGLLAAAGPESVVVAGTESVRQAFSPTGGADSNVKPFTPQLTLNLGQRISQVAFSADEEYLVISAEIGGGLAVYEVQTLMKGQTAAAFELDTKGTALRSLVQNPTPEKAELFAVITTKGELLVANVKARSFLNGVQGQIMKNGVSCVNWSNKGKALLAGLGDGTCYQMTPEGKAMAEIPRPSDLAGENHVASISWIENDLFLVGYNSMTIDDPEAPSTTFFVITRERNENPITREKNEAIHFQKLPEVCSPFGLDRKPPHFFIQRLRDFPPNIQDLVVVASTASPDISLFSRAKAPLTSDTSAEKIANVFTTTTMANDSRRAQLPMSEGIEDTSPIGFAIDLSAKEKVLRPLPGEEMDTSPGPVPALMVLNNEGILSAWWIIYADSVRQGLTFPGLVSQVSQPTIETQGTMQPAGFGNISDQPMSTPSQTPLGAVASTGFGDTGNVNSPSSLLSMNNAPDPSVTGAFGAPSVPGTSSSPWASSGFSTVNTNAQSGAACFGKPSFGNSSSLGRAATTPSFGNSSSLGRAATTPAFGAASGIGNRGSVWGGASSGAPQTGGNVFGQSSGLGMQGSSPFGAPSTSGALGSGPPGLLPESSKGGFASFANGPGFLSATPQDGGESPFAKTGTGASFMNTDTAFGGGAPGNVDAGNKNVSLSGFTLGSTFTRDDSGQPDLPKPPESAQNSMFGGFGGALTEAAQVSPQAGFIEAIEDDSDMAGSESSAETSAAVERTQVSKQAQPFGGIAPTATPKFGGLFGTQSQTKITPAAVQSSTPAPSIFGNNRPPTTTPAETPQKQQESSPVTAQTPPSPPIKPEPEDQQTPVGVSKSIPEAPIPPESTSKNSYAPGDSPNSSKSSAEDAPLPPDWNPSKTKLRSEEKLPVGFPESSEGQPLPADDEEDRLDDEGSGVDVGQEISPDSDPTQSLGITPESSFGASFGASLMNNVFVKPQQPRPSVKKLFGEVQQSNVPVLRPPSRPQQSPRSPSPVRLVRPGENLRPDNARSMSAPSRPQIGVAQQRVGNPPSSLAHTMLPSAKEQRQKEQEAGAARQAKQQAEEEQDLSDGEDERVREELERDVEPTKKLDDFLAHQDYIGGVTKPGIPGQIEKVYRDINSMVDTLGLNARALEGFVQGHLKMVKNGGRSFDDLEDFVWCLAEIEDLGSLENQLQEQLDLGRVQKVQEKLNACRELRKDLSRLKQRRSGLAKAVSKSPDEEKEANSAKFAPLTADQATQQHDIRKGYTKVQKLIAEAEGNIALLRAALASNDDASATKKPTVEAVTKTILKMTSMIEKKSGDIDVLEAQMRKLRFEPPAAGNLDDSREGSPAAVTTSPSLSRGVKSPSPAIESPSKPSDGARRMSGVTPEEVSRYRAKMQRRKEVNRIMHEAFAKAGPRLRGLE
ncbi:MAG: hypothetical protein Q9195_000214 [Heterodermia aff. obscurata]